MGQNLYWSFKLFCSHHYPANCKGLCPFYSRYYQGPEKLSNLLKITQLLCGRALTAAWVCLHSPLWDFLRHSVACLFHQLPSGTQIYLDVVHVAHYVHSQLVSLSVTPTPRRDLLSLSNQSALPLALGMEEEEHLSLPLSLGGTDNWLMSS